MNLNYSYKQILGISLPIMIGSAAQNVITLADSVFLYYYSEIYKMGHGEFASIGFVGVFYLIIAAIGFGYSKGGQIMIARRMGEHKEDEIGPTFHAMCIFELGLAFLLFLFMYYGSPAFFAMFVNSDIVYIQSLDYLEYRSFGVFFSYLGLSFIALYTGVARTWFILVATSILGIVNIVLNYALIFGHWGLPEMGIAGAGLASTIAEIVTFFLFAVYMLLDKKNRVYRIFEKPKLDWELIYQQFALSAPMIAQSVVGFGSWFFFFSIIENLGEKSLAITNLVRMIYLVLSIPVWGLGSGINTLVSHAIGDKSEDKVLHITWRTAKLAFIMTMVLALPVVLFPETILNPLLGGKEVTLIAESTTTFYVLGAIMAIMSVGIIYFNALAGVGATMKGLRIQLYCALFYMSYVYIVVEYTSGGLEWAWAGEVFYYLLLMAIVYPYMKAGKWKELKL